MLRPAEQAGVVVAVDPVHVVDECVLGRALIADLEQESRRNHRIGRCMGAVTGVLDGSRAFVKRQQLDPRPIVADSGGLIEKLSTNLGTVARPAHHGQGHPAADARATVAPRVATLGAA